MTAIILQTALIKSLSYDKFDATDATTGKAMEIISKDTDSTIASMLDAYDCPAILMTADYQVLACNDRYRESFGRISSDGPAYCYQVSHGYEKPCDQAGEDCPLVSAKSSLQKERVLHIHQTPRGPEHVDVELLPVLDEHGLPTFFIELLKPVAVASTQLGKHVLVGASAAFNKMLAMISRVGPSEVSVLLAGESGTGKELVAKALHDSSHRAGKPLVALECSGLTETLFESELFGHVKGAFTGANFTKQGLVEAADGGTLFLDEIGDIPYSLQVKLLRLIETGTYRPVGSTQTKRADFRLICATHKDLWQMVDEGRFRQDLFYRINVFPIHIPSLAQRGDDVALIANELLLQMSIGVRYQLTESALNVLRAHHFRGNIRELRNVLTRATVLSNTAIIDDKLIAQCLDTAHFTAPQCLPRQQHTTLEQEPVDLKTLERQYLQDLLQRYGDNKEKVAEIAGISVRSLYRKLQ